MSKIPQGQWSAIAARHAQGESISAIARTYGCTPPAIHYILKNNRRRATNRPAQAAREPFPMVVEAAANHEPSVPPGVSKSDRAAQAPPPASKSLPATEQAIAKGAATREQPLASAASARSDQHNSIVTQRPPDTVSRGSGGSEGLDSELHDRAEAAIEIFRSCFDAALAECSPRERARLREAASNLMRVAARTTIVLDKLNALNERARGANQNQGI